MANQTIEFTLSTRIALFVAFKVAKSICWVSEPELMVTRINRLPGSENHLALEVIFPLWEREGSKAYKVQVDLFTDESGRVRSGNYVAVHISCGVQMTGSFGVEYGLYGIGKKPTLTFDSVL